MFGPMASVRRRWSRLSAPSASSRSPRRPRSRGQRQSLPGSLSLSLALIVFSAPLPLLRRAHVLVSRHLRRSDSTQSSASFPASPSSHWLQLPSFGKPALSSPSRAHLAGVPPWSPVSWPRLCSPVFLLVLVPKASPCHRGLFRPVSDQRRRRSAAHHRRAAIREGKVLRCGRVRVSGTNRRGRE